MSETVKCPDSGAAAGGHVMTINALKEEHGEGDPIKGAHALALPDSPLLGLICSCVVTGRMLSMCDGG